METVPVKMSDIKVPSKSELRGDDAIRKVENFYPSFDAYLHSKSDPVALRRDTYPYEVYSGRHRVYVAAKKGYKLIPAVFT